MSVLTAPWFEYELIVQFHDGPDFVKATYSNFSVRPSGDSYVISYDAFTAGPMGKLSDSGLHIIESTVQISEISSRSVRQAMQFSF